MAGQILYLNAERTVIVNALVRPSICEATKSTLVVRVSVLEERVLTELVRD